MVIRAHSKHLTALVFTPDGKSLLTASDDGSWKKWNASTGKLEAQEKYDSPLTALAINSDGSQLAVGAWNGTVRICKLAEAKAPLLIKAHSENITSLAFSNDGRQLASGSGDDKAGVWDTSTGQEQLAADQGNEYDVTSVVFNRDGKWIMTGDGEGTVRVFDASRGNELQSYRCHEETIAGAVFLADDKKFATASWDDTVKIWDSRNGAELLSLSGHTDDVTCMTICTQSNLLVTGSADRTVRCWDITTGKTVFVSPLQETAVSAVAITSDGKRLAIGQRGNVTIMEVR